MHISLGVHPFSSSAIASWIGKNQVLPESLEASIKVLQTSVAKLRADHSWMVGTEGVSNYDSQLEALRTLDGLLHSILETTVPREQWDTLLSPFQTSRLRTGADRESEIILRFKGVEEIILTMQHRLNEQILEQRRLPVTPKSQKPESAAQDKDKDGRKEPSSKMLSAKKTRVLLFGLGIVCIDHIWRLEILAQFGIGNRLTDLLAVCGLWSVSVILWNQQFVNRIKKRIIR